MMEYDIDIEEHDVLSVVQKNSAVPDLTIVKSEIVNSECQDMEYMEIDDQQYDAYQDEYYNSYFDHSTSSPFEDIQIETNVLTEHEYPWANDIIVGNKSSSLNNTSESVEYNQQTNNHGVYDSVLVLEDLGPRLEKSERFCKECLILFSTSNFLESHKMSAHSLLVPCVPMRNKAIKSTSRPRQEFLDDVNEQQNHLDKALDCKKLCNHCNEYFTDENSLVKHLYEVLPNDFNTQNCINKTESKKNVTSKVPERLGYTCNICSCHFAIRHSVWRHALYHHKLIGAYTKQPFNKQCCFCKYNLQPDHYNSHIRRMHKEMYWKKPIISESSNAKIAVNVQIKTQKHVTKTQKQEIAIKSTKSKKQTTAVFKCKRCLLHFTSIFKASNHMPRCNGVTSKNLSIRNCKFCKLKFRKQDLIEHEKEHKYANFKVLDSNMGKRVLYKCPKCNLYYKSAMNRGHESKCCNFKVKYWCVICEINLCAKWKYIHIQHHKIDGYSKADFILLDGKDQNDLDAVSSDGDAKTPITTIYYCNKCGCCVNSRQFAFRHIKGNCKDINSPRVICSYCGLKFIKYSMKTHLLCHKNFFNLNMCKFLLLPNMKPIKPVIPKYVACNKCGVHIINSKVEHICSNKFVHCDKCNKKFSNKDYLLHAAFHEYSLDSTKSKQVNVPINEENNRKNKTKVVVEKKEHLKRHYIIPKQFDNKLYMCPICSALADDILVMKRHLNYHASSKRIKCYHCHYCKLKFDFGTIGRHEKLHKTRKFNKSKVKIIKVSRSDANVLNYKTENLDSTKIDKPKMVFYRCTKCNCAFPRQMCSENHICTRGKLKLCERCNLHFPIKDIYLHNILHKKTPNMTDHLSIIDYNPKDNIEQSNKETQKCKCPCGYQSTIEHLLEHYESCVVAKKFPKILAEIKAAQGLNECEDANDAMTDEKIELIKTPTEYTLFKCCLCNVLFMLNGTVIKHLNYCKGNNTGVKCDGCGLVFHALEMNRHKLKNNCDVLAKNKIIIEVSKNVANALRTVHKCDKCDVYFATKENLIQHSSNGHKVENWSFCKNCNVRFVDLDSHLDLHHVKMNLKFKNLKVVINNKYAKDNLKIEPVFKIKPKKPLFKAKRCAETTSVVESESKSNKEIRTLYKCSKCLLHFVEWSELFAHVLKTTHKSNGDVDEIQAMCGFCHKSFRESSLPIHLEKHHKTRKQIDFFIDTDVNSSRIIDHMATLKNDWYDPVATAICDISLRLRSETSEVKMNIDNELDNSSGRDNYEKRYDTEKLGNFEETIVESVENEKMNVDNKVNKTSGGVNYVNTRKLRSFEQETIIVKSVEKEKINIDNKVNETSEGDVNIKEYGTGKLVIFEDEKIIVKSVEKEKLNVDNRVTETSGGDNYIHEYSTEKLRSFEQETIIVKSVEKENRNVDDQVMKAAEGDTNANKYGTGNFGTSKEEVIMGSVENEKMNVDNKVNETPEGDINVNENGTGKLENFEDETTIVKSVENEKINVDKVNKTSERYDNLNGYGKEQLLGSLDEEVVILESIENEKINVDNKVNKTSEGDNNISGYVTGKLGSLDDDVIILN